MLGIKRIAIVGLEGRRRHWLIEGGGDRVTRGDLSD